MKFVSILAAAIFPSVLSAAPLADGAAEGYENGPHSVAELATGTTAARDTAEELFKRTTRTCTIVGSSANVNCRSGPGTQYPVTDIVYRGYDYIFTCAKTGECIVLNGVRNCGWDKTGGCYVNGHYTDSRCTLASLGPC